MYGYNVKMEKLNLSNHTYTSDYFRSMGKKKIKGIHITKSFFSSKMETDLEFLEGIEKKDELKVLIIDNINILTSSIDRLYSFHNITDLIILISNTETICLDLEKFPYLTNLTLSGNILQLHQEKTSLKKMQISRYKKKNVASWSETIEELIIRESGGFVFSDLESIPSLKKITLIQVKLDKLDGVGAFNCLRELKIDYCSKLTDISALKDCQSLEVLEFEGCKHIGDVSCLSSLKNLRELRLINCGEIPSLKFIEEMDRLKFLAFINTNVIDGDLTPCMRLEYAGTHDKRHYNIKAKDLPNIYDN